MQKPGEGMSILEGWSLNEVLHSLPFESKSGISTCKYLFQKV